MCSGTSIYNEGPRIWKNLFALGRFFFIYFAITRAKSIVRYIEDQAIQRFVILKFHCKIIALHFNSSPGDSSQTFFSFTNRDNRVKSSFLDFLSSEDSHKYTPCMSTVGNAKNNRVGLSENKMPTSYTIRTHALKKRLVQQLKKKKTTYDVSVDHRLVSQQPSQARYPPSPGSGL